MTQTKPFDWATDDTTPDEIADLLSRVPAVSLLDRGDRLTYAVRQWKDSYYGNVREDITLAPREEADLVSSKLENGMHAPAIDLDLECRLIPSSTPGHYHLYIDKEMSWKDYSRLLEALVECGIVEKDYYKMALKRGESQLRLPEKRK